MLYLEDLKIGDVIEITSASHPKLEPTIGSRTIVLDKQYDISNGQNYGVGVLIYNPKINGHSGNRYPNRNCGGHCWWVSNSEIDFEIIERPGGLPNFPDFYDIFD